MSGFPDGVNLKHFMYTFRQASPSMPYFFTNAGFVAFVMGNERGIPLMVFHVRPMSEVSM